VEAVLLKQAVLVAELVGIRLAVLVHQDKVETAVLVHQALATTAAVAVVEQGRLEITREMVQMAHPVAQVCP
jgi:hypothetical protein